MHCMVELHLIFNCVECLEALKDTKMSLTGINQGFHLFLYKALVIDYMLLLVIIKHHSCILLVTALQQKPLHFYS